MNLVIHVADRDAEIVIDGRGYSIPPHIPFEVPAITGTDHMTADYEYRTDEAAVAKEMVSKLWHVGLVEIPVTTAKTKRGINFEFDTNAALAEARKKLIQAEEQMLSAYVTQCRELISDGKAAQPPGERVAGILKKLGIDLKAKYGIVPIGYDAVAAGYAKNEENDQLRAQIADLNAKMEKFMAAQPHK